MRLHLSAVSYSKGQWLLFAMLGSGAASKLCYLKTFDNVTNHKDNCPLTIRCLDQHIKRAPGNCKLISSVQTCEPLWFTTTFGNAYGYGVFCQPPHAVTPTEVTSLSGTTCSISSSNGKRQWYCDAKKQKNH